MGIDLSHMNFEELATQAVTNENRPWEAGPHLVTITKIQEKKQDDGRNNLLVTLRNEDNQYHTDWYTIDDDRLKGHSDLSAEMLNDLQDKLVRDQRDLFRLMQACGYNQGTTDTDNLLNQLLCVVIKPPNANGKQYINARYAADQFEYQKKRFSGQQQREASRNVSFHKGGSAPQPQRYSPPSSSPSATVFDETSGHVEDDIPFAADRAPAPMNNGADTSGDPLTAKGAGF